MEYNISISVDNAAFGDEPEMEIARILRGLAESLVTSGIPGAGLDENGIVHPPVPRAPRHGLPA